MNNFNYNGRNNMYNKNSRHQPNRQNNMNRAYYNQQPQQEKPKEQHANTNSSQLDNLVNTASKHLNTTPDELKNAAQSGGLQKLLSNMTPSQAAQLEKILSDENATKKLLSTPQAQALLRGLQRNE